MGIYISPVSLRSRRSLPGFEASDLRLTSGCEDERAVPPAGRIGETDDIIGSCFVQDGKVSFFLVHPSAQRREGVRLLLSIPGCSLDVRAIPFVPSRNE